MTRRRVRWNVNPRYSAGSPAMVDERTAQRVADEEVRAYGHAREGVYGAEEQRRARNMGVGRWRGADGVERSIAEEVEEHRGHWMVRDLVTGEVYQRPFDVNGVRGKPNQTCQKCSAAHERALAAKASKP